MVGRRTAGRRPAVAVMALILLLVSGCGDLRELNQLALVMAVGVDKAEVPGRYQVTVQIARPGASGKGLGGGTGSTEGEVGTVYTARADGDTIFAAIRNLAQFTSRRIMWAHNNVVVIGDALAREDITPVVDFFTRNQELRMRTWVAIARGSDASTMVAAKTGMEAVPADSISALFRYSQLTGEGLRTDVNAVAADFLAPDRNTVIAALRRTERSLPAGDQPGEHGGRLQVELRGSAILKHNRLVGYLDQDAGRGLLWLRRRMRNAVLTLPCPGGGNRNLGVEVRTARVRIKADVSAAIPVFRVWVNASGWLSEQDCVTPDLGQLELKAYVEKELARKIVGNIRAALHALQTEMRTDAVGYGRLLHVQHPVWWRQHADEWDELFPQVRTEVSVATHIPKMGLYAKPLNLRSP